MLASTNIAKKVWRPSYQHKGWGRCPSIRLSSHTQTYSTQVECHGLKLMQEVENANVGQQNPV